MSNKRSVESRIKRAIKRFGYWERSWKRYEQFGVILWDGPEGQTLTDAEHKVQHENSYNRLVRTIISIARENHHAITV